MRAIVKGEIHISISDRKDLLSQISPDTEAAFIEGRSEDIGVRKLTFGYLVFLVGVLFYLWGQSAASSNSGQTVKEKIREQGINIHDKIDRGYADLYGDYPEWLKLVAGIIVLLVFLWALFMPADFRIVRVWQIEINFSFVERLVLIIGAPIGYSAFYIFLEGKLVGARDRVMPTNVAKQSQENGYDEIIVSCGQSHLKPMVNELEARGWTVEPHDTNHKLLAKLYRNPLIEERGS